MPNVIDSTTVDDPYKIFVNRARTMNMEMQQLDNICL